MLKTDSAARPSHNNPPHNNPNNQHRHHSRDLTLGISAATASMVCFSVMDATVKWLGADYPLHQIMFFRCTLAFVPILFILYRAGSWQVLRSRRPELQAIRAVLGVFAMAAAFYGFTTLPLADASSVFYTAPILAMAFSVFLLGEKVGKRRWAAVAVCMFGVLIIARPDGNVFNLGGLSMLAAAVLVGININLIRKLNQTDEAIAITFYFTATGMIATGFACLIWGWVVPQGLDLWLLISVGLLGGIGQYTLTLSFRFAQVSIIAPFKYLSIVIGGVLGFVWWSEVPDMITITGIIIIVSSGIYSIYREARLARKTDRLETVKASVSG